MNRDNDIRRAFQTKLDNYRPELPSDGWGKIEQTLQQIAVNRKIVIRRRWYASAAAAMLVMLIGSLYYLYDPMRHTVPTIVEAEPQRIEHQSISAKTDQTDQTDYIAEIPHNKMVDPSQAASVGKTSVFRLNNRKLLVRNILPITMLEDWMQRNDLVTEHRLEESLVNKDQLLAQSAGWRETSVRGNGLLNSKSAGDDPFFADNNNPQSRDDQLIIGMNGKGGLSSFRQTVNPPMTLRSASIPSISSSYNTEGTKNMLAASRISDNLSEMEHDQPISLGITLSKQLTSSLSIESGLSYSYLSSRLRNANANFRVVETQKIHYLGIPVNLNYTIVSFNRFNLYASVGGMIEKDIYGEYRKLGEGESAEFSGSAEEAEVQKISQRNPQLSVNAGVGLSYPVVDNLRLYSKIGGAYYFDSGNEYKTIYSDRKIVMDLNVGLRYEF